ncbi:MAG TPA: ketol-acid reductoisomerase, partial [Acidimicrobiaceae bacterium]|nr:ketol-acid reductoisomerase [Acidimicrobiaceae bacterium]
VVNAKTKLEMKKILKEIQSGKFAKEWIAESEAGRPKMKELQQAGRDHQIEEVGGQLRAMMPFLGAGKQKVADVSGG